MKLDLVFFRSNGHSKKTGKHTDYNRHSYADYQHYFLFCEHCFQSHGVKTPKVWQTLPRSKNFFPRCSFCTLKCDFLKLKELCVILVTSHPSSVECLLHIRGSWRDGALCFGHPIYLYASSSCKKYLLWHYVPLARLRPGCVHAWHHNQN